MDRRADEDGHAADLGGCGAVDVARDDELWTRAALKDLAQRVDGRLRRQPDLVELSKA